MIGYWLMIWPSFEAQVAFRRKCQLVGCQQSRSHASYALDPPTPYCWCTTKWKPSRFWMWVGGLRSSLKAGNG